MKGRDETEFAEGVRRNASGGKSVFVDYDLYAEYLEGVDLTEEQKHEFLQALWTIICEFVALGWGVHPVQQAQKARKTCGKPKESGPESAASDGTAVSYLDKPFLDQFTAATGPEEDRSGKGVQT